MVYCPTCGAELHANEKFCKYCGSEIEIPATIAARPPAPPVPPAQTAVPKPTGVAGKVPKKKMKKIGIVVIVLLAIAGGSYGILVAATWGTYDRTVPFAYYASGADYDNITLDVGMSIADINLDYVDAVDGAPLVQGAYEQHVIGSILGEFVFTHGQSGKSVNLALGDAVILFAIRGYARVNIQLLKNTTYTLGLSTSTGNINVTIPSGTKSLTGILATASTGNTKLVGNDMNVTGDVRATASTGNVNATFTNVTVTGALTTETSTGNLVVSLTQCSIVGNVKSGASTGNVAVTYTDTHVGGNFEFSTSTGNLDLKFVNLTIDNDAPAFWANCSTGNLLVEFQQRVELGGIMDADLQTSTGNINLYYKAVSGLNTGFKGIGDTSTGTVVVHPETGFSSGTGDTIQTDNYGTTTSKINALTTETSTGNVNIYATSLS